MANKRKTVRKPQAEDKDLLGFINTSAIDEMLEGIDSEIPAYKTTDKVEFVHAGGKFKGSVLKVLEEGKLKVVDRGGTVYNITVDDICKEGETASELISRKKGIKKPLYHQTELPLKEKSTKPLKKGTLPTAPAKKKTGEPTQRELVEALAEKGEKDYDVIAKKTGVTRTNVSQYMYRWKKANNKS